MNDRCLPYCFYNPVRIHFCFRLIQERIRHIVGQQEQRIGLFYGRNAMKRAGVIDSIKKSLPHAHFVEYNNIAPNPDINDILSFINNRWEPVDLCIAVGGGSVIDFTKTVAFVFAQDCQLEELLELSKSEKKCVPGIPLIAVPTTSGTGSEVTPWATIWDRRGKKKYSLNHEFMFPRHAVIDPALALTLPRMITAYTCFDALSHAIEAFWSKNANPISDEYALRAVALIMNTFFNLIRDITSEKARCNMAEASLYAGLAFSNTKTTAVHAVSYPMTIRFGIPHGMACALILGEFVLFNSSIIAPSKRDRLLKAAGVKDVVSLSQQLINMKIEAELPCTLSQAGIPNEEIGVILEDGFHADRVGNNPRKLTVEALKRILEHIA